MSEVVVEFHCLEEEVAPQKPPGSALRASGTGAPRPGRTEARHRMLNHLRGVEVVVDDQHPQRPVGRDRRWTLFEVIDRRFGPTP